MLFFNNNEFCITPGLSEAPLLIIILLRKLLKVSSISFCGDGMPLFSRVSCQSYFSYLRFTRTLAFSRVLDFLEALKKKIVTMRKNSEQTMCLILSSLSHLF